MVSLVVHGGAWDIADDMVDAHRHGVQQALKSGYAVLSKGGSAVEAVETAIRYMEDDETFDAGRGAFINNAGEVELDASIMDGKTFRAGAVAAVQNVKNPITLRGRSWKRVITSSLWELGHAFCTRAWCSNMPPG